MAGKIQEIAALGIFASYFLLILGLFSIILSSQIDSSKVSAQRCFSRNVHVYIFIALTLASFAHTWFYMFKFLSWSFITYESTSSSSGEHFLKRITNWLINTELFEQAWAAVCSQPANWWWSEQLCLFTVGAWTIFLSAQGRKYAVIHVWAYMLLGQVVAISVASNLFYLALVISPAPLNKKTNQDSTSPILWLSVLLSLIAVVLSPHTSDRTFLPNLLTMHALIALPLLPWRSSLSSSGLKIPTRTLCVIIALVSAVLRMRTTMAAFDTLQQNEKSLYGFMSLEWRVLHSHPAQSSIGWDVVWTTISFLIWTALSPLDPSNSPLNGLSFPSIATITGLFSVGVSAPLVVPFGGNDDNITKKAS